MLFVHQIQIPAHTSLAIKFASSLSKSDALEFLIRNILDNIPAFMNEKILGVIEVMQMPLYFFIFITDKRFIIAPPPPKETLQAKIVDTAEHMGVDAASHALGTSSFNAIFQVWKGGKDRDRYRSILKQTLNELSPQEILNSSKKAIEILSSDVKKVEMTRRRMSIWRYKNSTIKITTESNGKKTKKYEYQIIPPIGTFVNLSKRPVTHQEFNEYAELVRSLVQDKLTVVEDPNLGD